MSQLSSLYGIFRNLSPRQHRMSDSLALQTVVLGSDPDQLRGSPTWGSVGKQPNPQ